MRSLLISASVIACVSAIPPRDANSFACQWDEAGHHRTCTWQDGEQGSFFVPAFYKNMTLEVQGASGGASLNDIGEVDEDSRGVGLWFKAAIKEGLRAGTIFKVLAPVNGADATDMVPGMLAPFGHQIGGRGGHCQGKIGGHISTLNRQGGQGGSAAVFATLDKTAQLVIAGAGGAGANNRLMGCARGGLTSFVEVNQTTDGRDGNAWRHEQAGGAGFDMAEGLAGMSEHYPDGIRNERAGPGKSRESFPLEAFSLMRIVSAGGQGAGGVYGGPCLAGGGGGAGYYGAGGGGATTLLNREKPACAGGGGSGSNLLDGTFPAFEIIDQFNQYFEKPKIILTYEV